MKPALAWWLLLIAGSLDVLWAASMKLSEGYTRLGWTAISVAALIGFVVLLGKVLVVLPVGSAYVVWTGIGATGTVLLGAVLFGEPLNATRVLGMSLVVIGVVMLRTTPAAL